MLRRLAEWPRPSAGEYAAGHDDLGGDLTSRLSPYLHFGCLSPLHLAMAGMPDGVRRRQLCWRDFYHQLLAAFPKLATTNFRASADDDWVDSPSELDDWKHGNTGVAIVDAGMRQLLSEGWMHNRARLIAASYLTKTRGLDWRAGADWFMEHLVDADVANNYGNWQWVAGTGTDTKPYRRFSPGAAGRALRSRRQVRRALSPLPRLARPAAVRSVPARLVRPSVCAWPGSADSGGMDRHSDDEPIELQIEKDRSGFDPGDIVFDRLEEASWMGGIGDDRQASVVQPDEEPIEDPDAEPAAAHQREAQRGPAQHPVCNPADLHHQPDSRTPGRHRGLTSPPLGLQRHVPARANGTELGCHEPLISRDWHTIHRNQR